MCGAVCGLSTVVGGHWCLIAGRRLLFRGKKEFPGKKSNFVSLGRCEAMLSASAPFASERGAGWRFSSVAKACVVGCLCVTALVVLSNTFGTYDEVTRPSHPFGTTWVVGEGTLPRKCPQGVWRTGVVGEGLVTRVWFAGG